MGMTDRQFDAYRAEQVKLLKKIVDKASSAEECVQDIRDYIASLEAELRRP